MYQNAYSMSRQWCAAAIWLLLRILTLQPNIDWTLIITIIMYDWSQSKYLKCICYQNLKLLKAANLYAKLCKFFFMPKKEAAFLICQMSHDFIRRHAILLGVIKRWSEFCIFSKLLSWKFYIENFAVINE